MTTSAAARLYEAQHVFSHENLKNALYNPLNMPVQDLPVIFGFNNGGSAGWMEGELIAEDGTGLGGHVCSSEAYMPSDLGILEGSRPDRHENFEKHYPQGYRMDFVGYDDINKTPKLLTAFKLNLNTQLEKETR